MYQGYQDQSAQDKHNGILFSTAGRDLTLKPQSAGTVGYRDAVLIVKPYGIARFLDPKLVNPDLYGEYLDRRIQKGFHEGPLKDVSGNQANPRLVFASLIARKHKLGMWFLYAYPKPVSDPKKGVPEAPKPVKIGTVKKGAKPEELRYIVNVARAVILGKTNGKKLSNNFAIPMKACDPRMGKDSFCRSYDTSNHQTFFEQKGFRHIKVLYKDRNNVVRAAVFDWRKKTLLHEDQETLPKVKVEGFMMARLDNETYEASRSERYSNYVMLVRALFKYDAGPFWVVSSRIKREEDFALEQGTVSSFFSMLDLQNQLVAEHFQSLGFKATTADMVKHEPFLIDKEDNIGGKSSEDMPGHLFRWGSLVLDSGFDPAKLTMDQAFSELVSKLRSRIQKGDTEYQSQLLGTNVQEPSSK